MISNFRNPKEAIAKHRAAGITEQANIAYLLFFAAMNYFARLPGLYRVFQSGPQTAIDPKTGETVSIDFAFVAGWDAVWSIFGVILVMYALAGIAHFVITKRGGQGVGAASRRAMFWAAIMSLPFILLGAIATAFGVNSLAAVIGFGTLIYFLWYWGQALNEVHYGKL